MEDGGDIYSVFRRLEKACTIIEKEKNFSKTEHLGYITSCPSNLGTGLRASIHLKVPLLSNNKKKMNEIADKYKLQIRGKGGELKETEGDVFDVSNKIRLGKSEHDLVLDMYNGIKAMI